MGLIELARRARGLGGGKPAWLLGLALMVLALAAAAPAAASADPLTVTESADSATADPGGSDGYTITVSNPNPSDASLSEITDTLPSGFTYQTGSSTGPTMADPTISGQSLSWAGPITVPAGGSVNLHYLVTIGSGVRPGIYTNSASADSGDFPVTASGDTAAVEVSGNPILTVAGSGAGSGTITSDTGGIDCGSTCSATYTQGSQVTLTATADTGSVFAGWSGGGCQGSSPTCVVTLVGDTTVTASFVIPQSVSLNSVSTNFPSPIGIDYSETLNQLIMSVNYSGGSPNNFDAVSSDGTYTPFSTVSGVGGEVYFATIRTSSCQAGFTAGDTYYSDGQPGGIGLISADGTVNPSWVTLPGETGYPDGGIAQDTSCSFGGDLIVTTTAGDVWTVTSSGTTHELATGVSDNMEGPTTIPNDSKYGPWAGKILVSSENCGCVDAIGADGSTRLWPEWPSAEGVHIVPPNQNFYVVDYGSNTLDGIPASQFTNLVGDIVVFTETPGKLYDVRWDPTTQSFDSYDLLTADSTQFEGSTFAPAGLGTVHGTSVTTSLSADAGTVAAGASDGYTITVSNPTSSSAPLSSISATMPDGFAYSTGTSSGASSSDPGVSGQTLTWTGSFSVPANGTLTLHYGVTATTTPGTYDSSATATSDTFTVVPSGQTASVTVESATQHTLTVADAGSGSGRVSSSPSGISCGSTCSASFNEGTSVTLTATPATGSTFTGWMVDGSSTTCSGTGTCTVTISADHSVTATFAPITHKLTVARGGTGGGSVSSSPSGVDCGSTCAASFNQGTTVTLTATAASGSSFTGWSVDGSTTACPGTGTCQVVMGADHSVTATFDAQPPPVTVPPTVPGGGLFCGRNHRGHCDGIPVKTVFTGPGNAVWQFAAYNPPPGQATSANERVASVASTKLVRLGSIKRQITAPGLMKIVFKLKPGSKAARLYKLVRHYKLHHIRVALTFTTPNGHQEVRTRYIKLKL